MNAHRHLLAIATLAAAVGASPAQAGLLGGSAGLGGNVGLGAGPFNGSMNGQGTLAVPSPKPLVRAARDQEAAVQDRATAAKSSGLDKAQQARNGLVAAPPALQASGGGAVATDRQGAQLTGAVSGAAHR